MSTQSGSVEPWFPARWVTSDPHAVVSNHARPVPALTAETASERVMATMLDAAHLQIGRACGSTDGLAVLGRRVPLREPGTVSEMSRDRDDHVADVGVAWGVGLHAAQGRRVDVAAYGRYLGRWSRLFIPDLLTAATVGPGDYVLDLATGPGDAAAALVGLVGERGLVVGVDIATAMLEAASDRLANQQFWPVVADAQALPFRADCFDAVVCQLGLMFFPSPADALAECWRTLRPGRRNAVCVVSSPDRAPMWGVLADALSRHLPSQRGLLHLSFALADADNLAGLLDGAGFHDVRVTAVSQHGVVGSFDEYWEPIEAGTGQMPQAYLALPDRARRVVRAEVHERLAAFEVDGRYELSVEMLIGSGQK